MKLRSIQSNLHHLCRKTHINLTWTYSICITLIISALNFNPYSQAMDENYIAIIKFESFTSNYISYMKHWHSRNYFFCLHWVPEPFLCCFSVSYVTAALSIILLISSLFKIVLQYFSNIFCTQCPTAAYFFERTV